MKLGHLVVPGFYDRVLGVSAHHLLRGSAMLFAISAAAPASATVIDIDDAKVMPGELLPRALHDIRRPCSEGDFDYPVLDEARQEWFSSHLAAANEIALTGGELDEVRVRFTWLPSFDNPVIARIAIQPDGEHRLIAKRLSGMGGYEPGTIADQVDRLLDKREVLRLEQFVRTSDLLTPPPGRCAPGTDGARWVVEIADGGEYFFQERQSPTEGSLHEFGLFMLGLTGWDFERIY